MFTVYYAKSLRYASYEAPESLDPADYDKVAEVPVDDLEVVFRVMNAVDGDELCCQLRVRSMSVGDVAVDEDGVAHYCESCGWGRTTFASAEADALDLYNEMADQASELVEQGDVASARSLLAKAEKVRP